MSKLTLAQAAGQWLEARADEAAAKARKDQAADILKAHFDKTGRTSYKGIIGLTVQEAQVLDTEKLTAHHGDSISRFKRTTVKRFLTPLGG